MMIYDDDDDISSIILLCSLMHDINIHIKTFALSGIHTSVLQGVLYCYEFTTALLLPDSVDVCVVACSQ